MPPGPTHIEPGNIGLVLDTYSGNLEPHYMSAGTHYNGPWETVIEVPTMQRTISLTNTDRDASGAVTARAIQVNTPTNILTVDVSCQYHIDPDKADDLWRKFHEQFENTDEFEAVQLEPAVKEAVNYAMGDMDTMKALTTAGKQETEQQALKLLNDEWEPQGIVFSNFMVRGGRAGTTKPKSCCRPRSPSSRKFPMPSLPCSSKKLTTKRFCSRREPMRR